jgi:hypothetical protein
MEWTTLPEVIKTHHTYPTKFLLVVKPCTSNCVSPAAKICTANAEYLRDTITRDSESLESDSDVPQDAAFGKLVRATIKICDRVGGYDWESAKSHPLAHMLAAFLHCVGADNTTENRLVGRAYKSCLHEQAVTEPGRRTGKTTATGIFVAAVVLTVPNLKCSIYVRDALEGARIQRLIVECLNKCARGSRMLKHPHAVTKTTIDLYSRKSTSEISMIVSESVGTDGIIAFEKGQHPHFF